MAQVEYIGQGQYMGYEVPDKPFSEFTEEERQEFIAELKRTTTPETWDSFTRVIEILQDVSKWMQSDEVREAREALSYAMMQVKETLPLLLEEIEKDPETAGMSLREAVESDKFEELLDHVAARMEKPGTAITTKPVTALDFPLDKVNSKVWKLFEEPQPDGQMRLAIGVESEADKRKGKQIDIAYSIDFRELEALENVKITRKLEPFDKRVYIAIGAIYDSGQSTMSYQQIYRAMGYDKRAGAGALKKIDEAVTKMAGAKIFIDNLNESQEYKSRVHFKYDGPLLMTERITAMVDGQPAECVIRVHRSLVLLDFARERKQFTTIQRRLLDSPISKTNANIQLEDYLIERISHMKNGKAQTRILFATIYKNADIKTTKQKQRAWPKIQKLLDHYTACGFINGYTRDSDGVNIEL